VARSHANSSYAQSFGYPSDGSIGIRIVAGPAQRIQRVNIGLVSGDAPPAAGGLPLPDPG
jgi:hypothetical protein